MVRKRTIKKNVIKKNLVGRLGPPDEIISRNERMRHKAWRCANCGEVIKSAKPIPAPAPCPRCGDNVFTVFRDEPRVTGDD